MKMAARGFFKRKLVKTKPNIDQIINDVLQDSSEKKNGALTVFFCSPFFFFSVSIITDFSTISISEVLFLA